MLTGSPGGPCGPVAPFWPSSPGGPIRPISPFEPAQEKHVKNEPTPRCSAPPRRNRQRGGITPTLLGLDHRGCESNTTDGGGTLSARVSRGCVVAPPARLSIYLVGPTLPCLPSRLAVRTLPALPSGRGGRAGRAPPLCLGRLSCPGASIASRVSKVACLPPAAAPRYATPRHTRGRPDSSGLSRDKAGEHSVGNRARLASLACYPELHRLQSLSAATVQYF